MSVGKSGFEAVFEGGFVETALLAGLGEVGVVVGEGVTVLAGVVVETGLRGGYFRLIGLGGDAGGTDNGVVVLFEGALAVPVVAGVVVLLEGGVNG